MPSSSSTRRSESTRDHPKLLWFGLFAYGAVSAISLVVDVEFYPVSLGLLLAMALAFVGWHRISDWSDAKRYLLPAGVTVVFALLSGIAAWDVGAVYRAVTFGLWLLFILPGFVGVLREPIDRWALIFGLGVTSVVIGVVAMARVVTGEPVLDQTEGEALKTIVGMNRNGVNFRIVVLAPFLAWWVRRRPTAPHRWLLLGLVVFPIVATGGRAGLVALACGLLLHALLLPGIGRKVRASVMVVLIGCLAVLVARSIGGPLSVGIDRIDAYVLGERTGSDEARQLLVEKAWAVATENPFFGIGLENFKGVDHEVVGRASTDRVRNIARHGVAHNTYAQTLAELGFIGSFFLLLLVARTLAVGIRRSRDDAHARLATSAMGAYLVVLFFDSSLGGSLLYLTMALVVGTTLGPRRDAPRASTADVDPGSVVRSR